MGVKDLWAIIDPCQQETCVTSLCNKTFAVDLSIWMCENIAIGSKLSHPIHSRLYLRNLIFRILKCQQMGINLIFIADGEPPKLKYDTIMLRNNSKDEVKVCFRPHFKALSRKCKKIIDLLGIPCLQSKKESEAFCALLDKKKMVHGCISKDGDTMLYGAKTVYKNFDINTSSKEKKIIFYKSEDIHQKLRFSQKDLIGSALLLGCDYLPGGVPGVGKEQVIQMVNYLHQEDEEDLTNRIRRWRSDPFYVFLRQLECIPKPQHCTVCKHMGSYILHNKSCATKCQVCIGHLNNKPLKEITCKCLWHLAQTVLLHNKLDFGIYKKVARVLPENFPFNEIICEFTEISDSLPSEGEIKWKMPDLEGFLDYAYETLGWAPDYTLEKVLPLYANRVSQLPPSTNLHNRHPYFKPSCISKSVLRDGVPCYQCQWPRFNFDHFTPSCVETGYYTITTRKDVLGKGFPQLVQEYETSLSAKNGKKNFRGGCRGKIKQNVIKNNELIMQYMKPNKPAILKNPSPPLEIRSPINLKKGTSFELNLSLIDLSDTLPLERSDICYFDKAETQNENFDFEVSKIADLLNSFTIESSPRPAPSNNNDVDNSLLDLFEEPQPSRTDHKSNIFSSSNNFNMEKGENLSSLLPLESPLPLMQRIRMQKFNQNST